MSAVLEVAYRYRLDRSWAFGRGCICWVMLNPSTADEWTDDPTIRRVVRFSQDAGYARLIVVNLFAVRSTDPKHLSTFNDPFGPSYWPELSAAVGEAEAVVAAWGTLGTYLRQDRNMCAFLEAAGHRPRCLGMTKDGHPRHPLYVKADQPFVLYTPGLSGSKGEPTRAAGSQPGDTT